MDDKKSEGRVYKYVRYMRDGTVEEKTGFIRSRRKRKKND